jgi:DNA-binding MarR family transcriptional regulator
MGDADTGTKINRMLDNIHLVFPLFHRTLMRPDGLSHNPTNSEFRVLMTLLKRDSQPISKIGGWLGISKPNMTAVIDKLIADGYVERKPDTGDRRIIDITLTVKGRRYMEECKAELRESMKKKLSTLPREDIDSLYASLENIRVILMKLNTSDNDDPQTIMKMGPPWGACK